MSVIYKGSKLVQGPTTYTWKIGVGGSTRLSYTGAQQEIINQANYLQGLGYETVVTSGPLWTLEATIDIDLSKNPGTSEPEPTPQWELIPNQYIEDLFESTDIFSAELPAPLRSSIELKLKNPENTVNITIPESMLTPENIQKSNRIYVYKQMGVDGRRLYAVGLKRSIVVSDKYNVKWSIINVNKVWNTNTLISTYNVPTVFISLLPASRTEYKTIKMDDNSNNDVEIFYRWGWLESHPVYQLVSNNRVQISQEWVYGKYIMDASGDYGKGGLYKFAG